MMRETVPLPDPAVQPLVHPDDVPQARDLWRRAWLFSLVGSGCVLFFLGSVMWAVTGTWLAPTLAVLSTGAVAWFSQHRMAQAAWDHIPHRRQDRQRPELSARLAMSHLVDVLALAAGATTLFLWAARTGQGEGVLAYVVGAGAGVVLLVAGRAMGLARRLRAGHGGRLPSAVVLLVVALAVAAAAAWFTSADSPDGVAVLLGALTPVVAATSAWAWSRRVEASAEEREG
jgi:hypothetical protein